MSSLKWGLTALLVLGVSLVGGRPAAAQDCTTSTFGSCTLTTCTTVIQPGDVQFFNQCPGQTEEVIDFFGTVVSRTLFCTSPSGGSVLVTTVNVQGFFGVGHDSHHIFTGSQFGFTIDAGNGSPCSLVSTRVVNTTVVDTTAPHHGYIAPLVFLLTTRPVNGVCTTTIAVDIDRSTAPICF